MRRSLLVMAAAGAAATFALAPSASHATRNGQQGASRALSIATAKAVTVQPDGKIVAGGMRGGEGYTDDPAESADFALARYQTNGRLDPSFGKGGRATTDFGSSSDWLWAIVRQPNGKIVAAGSSTPRTGVSGFALARYDSRGRLDPSFGKHGKVRVHFGRSESTAYAIALQPDGKIVAAGSIHGEHESWVVARFNANGTLDRSFGKGGTVITDFEAGSDESDDDAWNLALGPDGVIVVAGATARGFTVALYDGRGKLDPSFGGTGFVQTDLSGESVARAVAIAPDGKIVAAGAVDDTRFVLVRYARDGALDPGFGKDGKVFTVFGSPITVLASFAAADKDHGVLAQWRTVVEVSARGFNVYRDQKGRRVRVNRKLLPSKGTPARGASYSFLDKAAPRHGAIRYWLQVVKRDGKRVWYGSVVPER